MFVIRAKEGEQPIAYPGTKETAYFKLDASGTPKAAKLEDINAGDYVEIGLDATGHITRLVSVSLKVQGTVASVANSEVTLQDGGKYPVTADSKATTQDGNAYEVAYLRPGDKVEITLNPADGSVGTLVVDLSAVGERTVGNEPKVLTLNTNYDTPLPLGGRLVVRARATAGGKATFSIGNSVQNIEMPEIGPGDYRADYRTKAGDDVINGALVCNLEVGGQRTSMTLGGQPITIDTVAPKITGISPANLANLDTASPTIQATYADAKGSGVNTAAVKMMLDGADVTPKSTVKTGSVYYQAEGLQGGNHTVDVTIADLAGNEAKLTSAFTVRAEAGNFILAVKHDATAPLQVGAMLTVTMEVAQLGRDAYFTIGDRTDHVVMQPIALPNTYRGQYQVKAADRATGVAITGYLVDADNRTHKMSATTLVDFAPVPDALAVTSPQANERLTSGKFSVTGVAPPGRKVKVTVRYDLFGRHEVGSDTVTADEQGAWKTKELDVQSNLAAMFVSEFIVGVQLLDDKGAAADSKEFKVKTGG